MYYFSNQEKRHLKSYYKKFIWVGDGLHSGPEHPHPGQNSSTSCLLGRWDAFQIGVMLFIASFVLEQSSSLSL